MNFLKVKIVCCGKCKQETTLFSAAEDCYCNYDAGFEQVG